MPKLTHPPLPLSALFAVHKPSGPSSMAVLDDIKALASASRLFVDEGTAKGNAGVLYGGADGGGGRGGRGRDKWGKGKKATRGRGFEVKIGQGGTLDPLADGVLVIGIGKGTKKLSSFLDCTKEYRTTCLLGSETDSYDSEGSVVRHAPWKHVTSEAIQSAVEKYRGEIQQTPPIFSALKMDGRPLYEYARAGVPLPRPIQPRTVQVRKLEMTKFEKEHGFGAPEKVFGEEERERLRKCLKGVDGGEKDADAVTEDVTEEGTPPVFTLEMCVSGGTYVRSLAHDIGHAVGSAAHVVTLTRTRQGRFRLDDARKDATESASASSGAGGVEGEASASTQATQMESETGLPFRKCVPWEVFEHALGGASGARRKSAHKPGVRTKVEASATTESTTDSAGATGEDGQEDAKAVVPDAVAEAEAPKVDMEDDVDEDGWRPWERAVMEAMEIVEDKKK